MLPLTRRYCERLAAGRAQGREQLSALRAGVGASLAAWGAVPTGASLAGGGASLAGGGASLADDLPTLEANLAAWEASAAALQVPPLRCAACRVGGDLRPLCMLVAPLWAVHGMMMIASCFPLPAAPILVRFQAPAWPH